MQEEIQGGHFQDVDELLTQAIHALREKSTTEPFEVPHRRLVDVLTSEPFAGSELEIQRPKDEPRPVTL